MTALYETQRPKTLSEICGHTKVLKRLSVLKRTTGLVGQVFWITGPSGMGKTTIARAIANEIAEPTLTQEVDAQDVTMDALRDWERVCQLRPLFGACHCFIINEAHGLSSKVVSRLQTLLEDANVQRYSTWIFTTTNKGEKLLFDSKMDACPFLSRAIPVKLEIEEDTINAMAQKLHDVATELEVNGKPVSAYVDLLFACDGNMRLAYQKIAFGEMLDQ